MGQRNLVLKRMCMILPSGLEQIEAEQLSLFRVDRQTYGPPEKDKPSAFSDPAFANNKIMPIHRWVPWIAGFSADFVRNALSNYLNRKSTVLDPFAGVGTTVVEGVMAGHNAIGFEINPYAALACRVKVNASRMSADALRNCILRFQNFYKQKVSGAYTPVSSPPLGFRTRASFYSPDVLHKVLTIQDFINLIEEDDLRDLYKLAFASTMVRYSNYSYEPSLSRRVSAGKKDIDDFPVARTILEKLTEMLEDVVWCQAHPAKDRVFSRIINDSFFQYERHLEAESVDLIITSPPYLNNYHYNRNTRPHLYWLGYVNSPRDMIPLEQANFGKYWQTVRDAERVDLDFSAPDTDLAEQIEFLRTLNPEKGVYGGNGWANYAASYFNDCYKFANGIRYALRRGGTALVVIGNSILQGTLIATDRHFGKIAESIGLELTNIHVPRPTRVGNSIIQSEVRVKKAKSSHQLYEAVVEIRKH